VPGRLFHAALLNILQQALMKKEKKRWWQEKTVAKIKDKKFLEQLKKDAAADTFTNPTKIEHLEVWRKTYDLTVPEVRDAIINYHYEGLGGQEKFDPTTFQICKLIEQYRFKNKCSVRKAIVECQKEITKLMDKRNNKTKGAAKRTKKKKDWTIDQIDSIHRRLVKNKPKLFQEWLLESEAHIELNK
jgi:hypothetical protein